MSFTNQNLVIKMHEGGHHTFNCKVKHTCTLMGPISLDDLNSHPHN